MRVVDGDIKLQFQCLVDPEGVLIGEKAKAVNGLTDEQIAKGRPQKLAFALLKNLIGDSTLIAHNAAFDLDFLNINYLRLGSTELMNNFLCTKTVAAFRYPAPHSLASLCERFGIVNAGAHRALNDVLATYQLLCKFQEAASVDEFINVLGHPVRFGLLKWKPAHATLRGY
jgi:DNA polymerase-3 subunit epsilon/DNA polymerase-3 subunit alpha (Gram-positive type)